MKSVYTAVLIFSVAAPLLAAEKAAAPDAQMQEAMKLMMPGEQHKALEPLVGRFTSTNKIWMKPGDKPMESKGTSENTWVYGNRFVKMEMKGDMHGQAFDGVGYIGYDNVKAQYTGVWLNNMNTGIAHTTGEYDAAKKTLTEKGNYSCPMTGLKEKSFREEWKIIDNDNAKLTMWGQGPDGKEMKMMETALKRTGAL
jgi:hypothetical protein